MRSESNPIPQVVCPYCWESIDPEGGDPRDHPYVMDCAVCCRPILISMRRGNDGRVEIEARRENE